MNRCFGMLLMGFLALAVTTSAASQQAAGPDVAKVVEGNNAFALELYSQLAKEDGNLFFSPYSISTALAMTYAGARGETATEMAKALHFGLGQDQLHAALGQLHKNIMGEAPARFDLVTANRLWGQRGYPYVPEFLKLTENSYGAALKEVDFENATEEARKAINGWVEEQTKEKIKELLKPKILDKYTRLVLTNAIYFKGTWAEQFSPKGTKPGDFKLSPEKSISGVPMMMKIAFPPKANATTAEGYHENELLQILAMPYIGNELSMVVLLPRAVDGLAEVEKALKSKPGQLGEWLGSLASSRVLVTLPKFKVTSEFRLEQQLKYLGMLSAFDKNKADFSGISSRAKIEQFHISAVVHKTFVDVNEAGTEAAAAAAVILKGGGKPPMNVEFRADHPFLYLIRDNRSGSILFIGRLVNPKA